MTAPRISAKYSDCNEHAFPISRMKSYQFSDKSKNGVTFNSLSPEIRNGVLLSSSDKLQGHTSKSEPLSLLAETVVPETDSFIERSVLIIDAEKSTNFGICDNAADLLEFLQATDVSSIDFTKQTKLNGNRTYDNGSDLCSFLLADLAEKHFQSNGANNADENSESLQDLYTAILETASENNPTVNTNQNVDSFSLADLAADHFSTNGVYKANDQPCDIDSMLDLFNACCDINGVGTVKNEVEKSDISFDTCLITETGVFEIDLNSCLNIGELELNEPDSKDGAELFLPKIDCGLNFNFPSEDKKSNQIQSKPSLLCRTLMAKPKVDHLLQEKVSKLNRDIMKLYFIEINAQSTKRNVTEAKQSIFSSINGRFICGEN